MSGVQSSFPLDEEEQSRLALLVEYDWLIRTGDRADCQLCQRDFYGKFALKRESIRLHLGGPTHDRNSRRYTLQRLTGARDADTESTTSTTSQSSDTGTLLSTCFPDDPDFRPGKRRVKKRRYCCDDPDIIVVKAARLVQSSLRLSRAGGLQISSRHLLAGSGAGQFDPSTDLRILVASSPDVTADAGPSTRLQAASATASTSTGPGEC